MHLASPFFLGARGSAVAQHLRLPTVAVYQTDAPAYAAAYGQRRGSGVLRMDSLGVSAAWRWLRAIHNAAGLEGSWDGESVYVDDVEAAYDLLRGVLRPGDVVLVKSSKSAGLRFLGDRLAGLPA